MNLQHKCHLVISFRKKAHLIHSDYTKKNFIYPLIHSVHKTCRGAPCLHQPWGVSAPAGAARCSGKAQKRPGQKAFHGRSSVGKSWARPSAEADFCGGSMGAFFEKYHLWIVYTCWYHIYVISWGFFTACGGFTSLPHELLRKTWYDSDWLGSFHWEKSWLYLGFIMGVHSHILLQSR